jgi:Ala-tRNA(Pro) deacylase
MATPPDHKLTDGSEPASPEELFRRLEELGISARTINHPPVFTVAEAKALRGQISGAHTKNLFLRDKKGAMWLLVCPEDRKIDLKTLAGRLSSARLSFGSPRRLMEYLGVTPGAVTPFAIINDKSGQVKVVLDRALLAAKTLNFHPLDNAMTTSIATDDLVRFLEAQGHPPELIDLRSCG